MPHHLYRISSDLVLVLLWHVNLDRIAVATSRLFGIVVYPSQWTYFSPTDDNWIKIFSTLVTEYRNFSENELDEKME